MKVSVNRQLCSGHARCMATCPEVFGSDELGYCVIANPEVPAGLQELAVEAVRGCPEGALSVTDD